MRILVFAGAGTSLELGVPVMEGMAIEFRAHAEQWNVEPKIVIKLMGDVLDVEHLIESVDKICEAREPLEVFGGQEISIDRVEIVRSELEWFVQHAAERIVSFDAELLWGSVLRTAKDHTLTFVTTNYDRAIELAANAVGVSLSDGYNHFGGEEVAAWAGFPVEGNGPLIVKLHGSTDWYSEKGSEAPLKLRHPMPLFGRGTLRLSNGKEMGSALILPSREKLLSKAPYPRLSQAFLNHADTCEVAVFVGSSLRDNHVRTAASTIAATRPLFVVNPEGNSFGIDHAHAIAQPASQFLISTLPAALSHSEPTNILMEATENPGKMNSNVLQLLKIAMSAEEDVNRRCEAIEILDQESVVFDDHLVRALISNENANVSRYALGLVPGSSNRKALLTTGLESPHATDQAFADELEYLKKMVKSDD